MPETPETPATYKLTENERKVLQVVNQLLLQAKAKVFDVQAAYERAQADVRAATDAYQTLETQWHAHLSFLAASQGMTTAQISPDMTILTVPKGG